MQVINDSFDISYRFGSVKLSLCCTEEGVWRIVSENNGHFDYQGAAQTLAADLHEDISEEKLPLSVKQNGDTITVVAPDGGYVEITQDQISFYNNKKVLKRCITAVKKSRDSFSVTIPLVNGERIFGTGERFNNINQRGKKVQIYAIDKWCKTEGNSYIPIPIAISSNCTGMFFNRYEHSVFDIGKSSPNSFTAIQKHAPIDLYIIVKDKPAEILTAYSRLTGFAPMPPEWSFGTLVCRYYPDFSTKEGIFSMVEEMEKNDFPWEGIITEGWETYDSSRWNELKEVSDKIHQLGKKMMVYQTCGRFPTNADKELGLSDKLAVQSTKGVWLKETHSMNLKDNFYRKKMRCVDLTDEKSLSAWMKIWDKLVHEVGVDGAKIDFCEQFPDKKSIRFSDGRSPLAAHHWYPTLYNMIMFRKFNERANGGLNYSRGGGIGIQRCPFVWTGDQRRDFFFLRAVVKAALSLGLSGVPFVSWDMAGYMPSFNREDKRDEHLVFIRGTEFTCFSTSVQTHGNVKRPYDFDKHTKDIYRAYTKLHDSLRPYLISQADISCKTGIPMMRHLFLYDSEDKNCFDIEDEYMLGNDILVAPILDRKNKRDIYLPKGKWINVFTGDEYDGNRTLTDVEVKLEQIPVFRLKNCSDTLLKVLENSSELIKEINILCR